MIERILLYPAHIAELLRVRGGIHSVVATLDAVRLPSKEPVPFEEAASSDMKKTRKGQVWGGLYDCCWFRFRGRVPESAKGRHSARVSNSFFIHKTSFLVWEQIVSHPAPVAGYFFAEIARILYVRIVFTNCVHKNLGAACAAPPVIPKSEFFYHPEERSGEGSHSILSS